MIKYYNSVYAHEGYKNLKNSKWGIFTIMKPLFRLHSPFPPAGSQPEAIDKLEQGPTGQVYPFRGNWLWKDLYHGKCDSSTE